MKAYRLRLAMSTDLSKEEKCNREIIFVLCCILFIPAINNFLNSILQTGLSIYLEFLTPLAYIFMAFTSVFILYKYILIKKVFLGILMFFFVGVSISYLLYPEIRNVIYSSPVDLVYSPVNKLFFFCIPSLIGAACLTDYNTFFERMRRWGRFTTIMGIVTFCFIFFYVGKELQYMIYSYFMLLPICICYEYARVKKSKIDFVTAVCGTGCIVMCGARGAILSLIMYFVLRLFLGEVHRVSVKKVIQLVFLMTATLGVCLFYEELLAALLELFYEMGVNSRFISSLVQGELLEDSGRSSITTAIIEGVKNNPFGYGLYGDRYVAGRFGNGNYRYSHNIISELICDFGIIGGSIIILVLLWKIGKMFIVLRNKQEINIMLALLPYGVFQLFFSSSFLENVAFFIIIGLIFRNIFRKASRR